MKLMHGRVFYIWLTKYAFGLGSVKPIELVQKNQAQEQVESCKEKKNQTTDNRHNSVILFKNLTTKFMACGCAYLIFVCAIPDPVSQFYFSSLKLSLSFFTSSLLCHGAFLSVNENKTQGKFKLFESLYTPNK